MLAAMDAVRSAPNRAVLVCTADTRLGAPSGVKERDFGDGGASLLIGNNKVIATLEGTFNICDEIIDVWRADKDKFVNSWEDRFIKDRGYSAVVTESVSEAMKRFGIVSKEVSKFVCYTPNLGFSKCHKSGNLGLNVKTQVQDSFMIQLAIPDLHFR